MTNNPFSPITFKSGAELENRLVMAPMTNSQSLHDGQVSLDEIKFYQERDKGLGAVIVSAANATAAGKGWFGELSIADDKFIPNLTKLANAIHSDGAKAIIQIFHVGRLGHERIIGAQPIAPSAVLAHRPGSELPRAMTEAEIDETIAAFGEATRRAIAAGFDGVEIHGANGYLLQEFFSSHANHRTDQWGGSIEKRFSFIQETTESALAARQKYAKSPFIVGYRFSPEEFGGGGIQMSDTLWLLDHLIQFPLDYLHVSLTDYKSVSRNPAYNQRSILSYLHERIDGQLPLIGVGSVRTRTDVNSVLENSELVAIGQQLIADPTWPLKLQKGQDSEFDLRPLTNAVLAADVTPTFREYLVNRFIRLGMLKSK